MSSILCPEKSSQYPLMSVIILTYKRQDELLRTLQSLQLPQNDAVEVIVVNNNPDDTGEILSREFPEVKYIDTGGNIGCEARNKGVEAATADLVVTIDNDVNMKDGSFVTAIINFFATHPDAGCVNFKVLNPECEMSLRDWCHPRDYIQWSNTEFLTDHISEGAVAFKKSAFVEAEGYFAPFFIGHEGPDLCFRLMKLGYEVWYTPNVQVLHYASNDARPSWRAYYYNTRNNIWLAYRHFPVGYAMKYICYYTGMMMFYSIRSKHLTAFFKGIVDGFKIIGNVNRVVMNNDVCKALRAIQSMRPGFIAKMRKHLLARQTYR